eukprot:6064500-Amphidinium_carterae.4
MGTLSLCVYLATRLAKQLREQGAEIIIALTHMRVKHGTNHWRMEEARGVLTTKNCDDICTDLVQKLECAEPRR